METNNILLSNVLDGDSYKFSHYKQYPPNTTAMFSYLESRGGDYPTTVFFGLQYYLKKYLSQTITVEQVEEAKIFSAAHGVPFNYDGWMRIATVLKGKLPVIIKAVPEGTELPTSNILMSVESTDPETFWVVSWIETMLVRLWYPITVATQSRYIKALLRNYLEKTSDDPEGELPFKLHDFGSRGVSSQESAMIGGASHLVNFLGSDTIAGIYMANKYYHGNMAGYSIPASEHSTMTMWGKDNEVKAYDNMLEQYKHSPIFACVSDSYDIYNAAENIWGGELKQKVIDFPGTVVIRPDSGYPPEVVAKLLEKLDDAFGHTVNSKGYKVLNHNVRIIQGDGVNYDSIARILHEMVDLKYSVTNIAFGMGGALLQQMNRDTLRFAFKCSWAEVDGKGVDVYKDPVTDTKKKSKRGKLDLITDDKEEYVRTARIGGGHKSLLRTVFKNGQIMLDVTLESIRDRANAARKKVMPE
jgi:nicotinamide phosphoribosyltransferase